MKREIIISLHNADITTVRCDVVALKFARHRYGVDKGIFVQLMSKGVPVPSLSPAVGQAAVIDSRGVTNSPFVMFVGTPQLFELDYEGIATFARDAVIAAAAHSPPLAELAMTLHGPGFGRDELESARALVEGCMQALPDLNAYPHEILVVERDPRRYKLVAQLFGELMRTQGFVSYGPDRWALFRESGRATNQASSDTQLARPSTQSHVFVAMPFAAEFDDVYYYGIQRPIHEVGLLCERVDQSNFTGDVMEYVKSTIQSAKFVVAEITSGNANVFLEIGYAWGRSIPTILLARAGEKLLFDVRGQRCLVYDGIRQLEQKLTTELKGLMSR